MVKIKLCGLFRPEDICSVNQVMPDYAGFVLAEGFRRGITRAQAARFREMLDHRIPAVGVFVNDPCEKIIACLEEGIIQMAQLHGDETEEDIQYIQAVTGKPVSKAVRVRNRYDVEAWLDSAADYLIFDGGAGSGVSVDRKLLEGVEREYFLAGGFTPDNLEEAMNALHPYAVDISSGVETQGLKDPEKMSAAVRRVREFREPYTREKPGKRLKEV